jgi:hypothetical protein
MQVASFFRTLVLVLLVLMAVPLLFVLPFIVLIKGMIIAYDYGLSGWVSLLCGSLATFAVIFVYLVALDRSIGRRIYMKPYVKVMITGVIVGVFVSYVMLVMAQENVKNTRLISKYQDMHPILRVGVRTWSFFDRDILITDMTRSIKDYRKMRVRAYRRSLHFRQKKTGYVHAFDIRTKGRTRFQNWLTQVVFKMMGFKTLRHGGTADHLHVELVLPGTKGTTLYAKHKRKHRKKRYRKRKGVRSKQARRYTKRKQTQRQRKSRVADNAPPFMPEKKTLNNIPAKPQLPVDTRRAPGGSEPAMQPPSGMRPAKSVATPDSQGAIY